MNTGRFRTKKVTNSLDPTWDEVRTSPRTVAAHPHSQTFCDMYTPQTFYYHIPAGSVEGLVVEVDVYDWDVVGTRAVSVCEVIVVD